MSDLRVTVIRPANHPDHDWIRRLRDALDHWEAVDPTAPTSSVLGTGAVAAAEKAFSDFHGGRPSLLLPSATYALRVALLAVGARRGDEVICPGIDWPSSVEAVVSIGAKPVPVMVDPDTLTISPDAAAGERTSRTRAVIACHLHGVCADVPVLRQRLPGIPIVEDAAQALGSRLNAGLAGTLGDVAVLSVGPGKTVDAGEGGVLLCGTARLHKRAVAAACHPLRRLLSGGVAADRQALCIRPHPVAAVLAWHGLMTWSLAPAHETRSAILEILAREPRIRPIAQSSRHGSAQAFVPVLVPAIPPPSLPDGICWCPSGAQVLPGLAQGWRRRAEELLGLCRLVTLGP